MSLLAIIVFCVYILLTRCFPPFEVLSALVEFEENMKDALEVARIDIEKKTR